MSEKVLDLNINKNNDVEKIYNNYKFGNMSQGDIDRINNIAINYYSITSGHLVLHSVICKYISDIEKAMDELKDRKAVMNEFLENHFNDDVYKKFMMQKAKKQ